MYKKWTDDDRYVYKNNNQNTTSHQSLVSSLYVVANAVVSRLISHCFTCCSWTTTLITELYFFEPLNV